MGVVRLAHDVVLTDLVDAGDPVVVLDEAAEDVVTEELPDVEGVQVDVGGGVLHESSRRAGPSSAACRAPARPARGSTASTRSLPRTGRSSDPGKRANMPLNSHESMAPDVRIAPQARLAMNGESGAICGTCDDEPTCMQATMPRSEAAAMTGSQ